MAKAMAGIKRVSILQAVPAMADDEREASRRPFEPVGFSGIRPQATIRKSSSRHEVLPGAARIRYRNNNRKRKTKRDEFLEIMGYALGKIVGTVFLSEQVQGATTLLHFRHLLEASQIGRWMFTGIKRFMDKTITSCTRHDRRRNHDQCAQFHEEREAHP
jgi:hypothetical protein